MNKLVVILGPTSTGKTSLAIKLCKKFNGEIISCDSRQVYRFMDIGTGKLPASANKIKRGLEKWEVDETVIRLYDVISPCGKFSVHDFAQKAVKEVKKIWTRGKIPFLVGGTGFYIDVVIGRQKIAGVDPDWKLRENLSKYSVEELFEKLRSLDSDKARVIDRKNKIRLMRAIEIASNPKEVQPETSSLLSLSSIRPFIIGLTAPRKKLYARADSWVLEAVNRGLIPEVKDLVNRGYKNCRPMQGLVYKTVISYLEERISYSEMIKRIKFDLHGYIRRQMTWFARNTDIKWYDIIKPGFDNEIEAQVQSYLKGPVMSNE